MRVRLFVSVPPLLHEYTSAGHLSLRLLLRGLEFLLHRQQLLLQSGHGFLQRCNGGVFLGRFILQRLKRKKSKAKQKQKQKQKLKQKQKQ